MSDDESEKDEPIEILFAAPDEQVSEEDPPMSEWSSLEISIPEQNKKKLLYAEGLYKPGSGEICAKYLMVSDSSIFRHPYYNYPAVTDPGIEEAILVPENPIIFSNDGQDLYLKLCDEMNICPVRLFHKNLLSSKINLSYYGVDPKGVRAMAEALQHNNNVSRLDLTSNFLSDDACYHLGRMLFSNTTLSELILDGCRIGASGMLRLGDNLQINRSLTCLNIANNNLCDAGGIIFAQQIFDGATVADVNLSNNELGRPTAYALAEVLEWRNYFTHLDLSWNNFYHAPSTVKLLDNLALSTDLIELNLSYNALEGERVANAIKNILLIPTLVVLNLSHNRLQNEAIDIIITNLFQAKKLDTLNLSFNPLTTRDAHNVLQKMLRPRVKINNLLMESICVQKPFIDLLARVKRMKSRKNFVCVFDSVLQNWAVDGPDPRDLILQRAQYLGRISRRNKVDTALYFLALAKEYGRLVATQILVDRASDDRVPLDEDLIKELSWVFAGPKTPKTRTIDLNLISEYINRIWPDKKLPLTPPPEPEPEPDAPPPKLKGKGKGKK